jgi:DNA primase
MVKLAQSTIKYLIESSFTADGLVERPDIIGAVFGQTEGLLGSDLDLRELQRTGRIGRIDVESRTEDGKTIGKIFMPSSLDSSDTSLIAASMEAIEKIGPHSACVSVVDIKDVRGDKREAVMKRAKTILETLLVKEMPDTDRMRESIKDLVRTSKIKSYLGMPAGPAIELSDEIVVVEGRADVLNLLKSGINNVVATGGANVPQSLINLSREKLVTLFVDGDRAGDLIIKEFTAFADVDYIVKAPEGKEVEDLSKKEIFKALREKVPIEQYKVEPRYKDISRYVGKQVDSVENSTEETPSYTSEDSLEEKQNH